LRQGKGGNPRELGLESKKATRKGGTPDTSKKKNRSSKAQALELRGQQTMGSTAGIEIGGGRA